MSSRGATGAGNKSRVLNVNSVSGRSTAAQEAGGENAVKMNMDCSPLMAERTSCGEGECQQLRALPSLKAEHGQDSNIAIVPQDGTGWTVNKPITPTTMTDNSNTGGNVSSKTNGSSSKMDKTRISAFSANSLAVAAVGHDLHPTWAKPAVPTGPNGTMPIAAAGQPALAASAPPPLLQQDVAYGRTAQHQQPPKNSSERDFETLAEAASNLFQAHPQQGEKEDYSSSDTKSVFDAPPVPLIPEPQPDGENLPKFVKTDEEQDPNIPTSHRRLPLELECEIFKCFKLPIQFKFFTGLGRGIYEMFGPKIRALKMSKRLLNPAKNSWKSKHNVTISPDGLQATTHSPSQVVCAEKAFSISVKNCRKYCFLGTILYYYEVTNPPERVGFSNGFFSNTFGASNTYYIEKNICCLSGKKHHFEWPAGAIKPTRNGQGDVIGCALLLNTSNQWAIFFTLNGILLGKQIRINPADVDHLFPTIFIRRNNVSVDANFGGDPAKPFHYDIKNCPGLH